MHISALLLSACFLTQSDSPKHLGKPAEPAEAWVSYAGAADLPCAGHTILLIAGDEEYRSEEALPMLAAILSLRHGFDTTVLFSTDPETGVIDPMNQVHTPGLSKLADADLLVIFTRFREWPDEDMQHFASYVDSGKPIIGLRTATHAFQYKRNPESPYAHHSSFHPEPPGGFGRQILGETWVNHHGGHGSQSTRGVIDPQNATHPILRGVTHAWGPTDVYGIRELPADAHVLLRGQVLQGMSPTDEPLESAKNDPMMPLVWTRETRLDEQRTRRVVCSTIGASEDFESEGLRRVFINAAYWCLELEHLIPDASAVDYITKYEPSPFGHGKYRRDVRPGDHALKR
jgi:type 1 glutamine amidotransferase